jgi:hypothetical protein
MTLSGEKKMWSSISKSLLHVGQYILIELMLEMYLLYSKTEEHVSESAAGGMLCHIK